MNWSRIHFSFSPKRFFIQRNVYSNFNNYKLIRAQGIYGLKIFNPTRSRVSEPIGGVSEHGGVSEPFGVLSEPMTNFCAKIVFIPCEIFNENPFFKVLFIFYWVLLKLSFVFLYRIFFFIVIFSL